MQTRRSFIKYIIGLLLGLFGIKYKPNLKEDLDSRVIEFNKWDFNTGKWTEHSGVIYGYRKVIFNNKDYGVVTLNGNH